MAFEGDGNWFTVCSCILETDGESSDAEAVSCLDAENSVGIDNLVVCVDGNNFQIDPVHRSPV